MPGQQLTQHFTGHPGVVLKEREVTKEIIEIKLDLIQYIDSVEANIFIQCFVYLYTCNFKTAIFI